MTDKIFKIIISLLLIAILYIVNINNINQELLIKNINEIQRKNDIFMKYMVKHGK